MSWRTPLQLVAFFGLLVAVAVLAWRKGTEQSNYAAKQVVQQDAKTTTSELLLPESERTFLWECEHRGNLLSQIGFPRISAALKRQKTDELLSALTVDFRASVPDDSLELHRQNESVWRTRATNLDKAPREKEFRGVRELGFGPPR